MIYLKYTYTGLSIHLTYLSLSLVIPLTFTSVKVTVIQLPSCTWALCAPTTVHDKVPIGRWAAGDPTPNFISASMSLVTRSSSKWIEVWIPYKLHQLMLLLLSPFGALMVWAGEGENIRAGPILLGLCCCELGLGLGGGGGGGWGDVELISSPFWTHSGGRNINKTKIIMAITFPLPVTREREDMYSNSGPRDLKSPQEDVCKKLPCSADRCYHLVTSLRMKPTHGGGQSQENHILSPHRPALVQGSLGFSSTRCPFSIG